MPATWSPHAAVPKGKKKGYFTNGGSQPGHHAELALTMQNAGWEGFETYVIPGVFLCYFHLGC